MRTLSRLLFVLLGLASGFVVAQARGPFFAFVEASFFTAFTPDRLG